MLRGTLPCVLQCLRSTALVTPQNWLFLGSFKRLRKKMLSQAYLECCCPAWSESIPNPNVGFQRLLAWINLAGTPRKDIGLLDFDAFASKYAGRKKLCFT